MVKLSLGLWVLARGVYVTNPLGEHSRHPAHARRKGPNSGVDITSLSLVTVRCRTTAWKVRLSLRVPPLGSRGLSRAEDPEHLFMYERFIWVSLDFEPHLSRVHLVPRSMDSFSVPTPRSPLTSRFYSKVSRLCLHSKHPCSLASLQPSRGPCFAESYWTQPA